MISATTSVATAVSGPMLAQLSTSVTDDRIRMIIVALLVVALLLGLTTAWYFVHTSPRRRQRATPAARPTQPAQARPQPAAQQRIDLVESAPAAPRPSEAPTAAAAPRVAAAPTAADDDADWLRLTGPETPTDPARRTHG